MRFFAIGDVHLPGGPRAKTMDRFGAVWHEHPDRVREHWHEIASDDDVLLIVGDLSWAMTIEEAKDDLAWIGSLRGTKVVIRGNHDYWWSGIGKVRRALPEGVIALQHDHVVLGGVAIVGTRGWQCPGSLGSADAMDDKGGGGRYTAEDETIHRREVERLRLGLDGLAKSGAAYDALIVMLHYPPMNPEHEASGFTELVDAYRADVVVHGHLHGEWVRTAFEGTRNGARYHCVSADAVGMRPRLVWPEVVAEGV